VCYSLVRGCGGAFASSHNGGRSQRPHRFGSLLPLPLPFSVRPSKTGATLLPVLASRPPCFLP
jgi:hypothetical protein